MTDAPAFFRAIEADPADDTRRLAFADWLDENATSAADHARAEFIRVQCARAHGTDSNRWQELKSREEQILAEHGRAWAERWPCKIHRAEYLYHRGFLEPVACDRSFPRHAGRLAELMPLTHVRLRKPPITLKTIGACPQLALVRHLSLLAHILRETDDLVAFAASPYFDNLRHLDLADNGIGSARVSNLTCAHFPCLRVFEIADNPIEDAGVLALARVDWPALEHLDLSRCKLGRAGVVGLAERPLASRLTDLRLTANAHVPTDAWLTLARAPMRRLDHLCLNDEAVTDEVAEALAANPALENLRRLNLGGSQITDRGARAILDSPHLKLKRLLLTERRVDASICNEFRNRLGDGFNPRSGWYGFRKK